MTQMHVIPKAAKSTEAMRIRPADSAAHVIITNGLPTRYPVENSKRYDKREDEQHQSLRPSFGKDWFFHLSSPFLHHSAGVA